MLNYIATETPEVLPSCCCCLQQSPQKNLKSPYSYNGKTEIYLDMLHCLDIQLDVDSNECGICLACVGRLRDASDFKIQVRRSQAELRARLERTLQIKDEKPNTKTEKDDIKEKNNLTDDCPSSKTGKADADGKCDELPGDEPAVKSEFADDCDDFILYYADEEPLNNSYLVDDSDDEPDAPSNNLQSAPTLPTSHSKQLAFSCSVRLQRVDLARVTYPCHSCHTIFLDMSSLDKHVKDSCRIQDTYEKNMNNDSEFTCDSCGKRFKRKASFEKHMQTHMTKESSNDMLDQKNSNKDVIPKISSEIPKISDQVSPKQIRSKKISDQKEPNHIRSKKISDQKEPNHIRSKKISDQKVTNQIKSKKTSEQKESNQIRSKNTTDQVEPNQIKSKKISDNDSNQIRSRNIAVPKRVDKAKPSSKNSSKTSEERLNEDENMESKITRVVYRNRTIGHSGKKSFTCKICQKDFARLETLKKHQFIHKRSYINDLKRQFIARNKQRK